MSLIDHATALALFDYNPDTGIIKWRVDRRRVRAGDIAGFFDEDGYRKIKTGGRLYFAHRLAWFATHKRWPVEQIDHINGVKDDNRLCNLREATPQQNQYNISGRKRLGSVGTLKGASFCQQTGRWRAGIRIQRKNVWLGRFDTEEAAHQAYVAAAQKHFQDYSRAG